MNKRAVVQGRLRGYIYISLVIRGSKYIVRRANRAWVVDVIIHAI